MMKLTVAFQNFVNAPINANLSLSTPRRCRGGADIQLHSFLTSGHDGGEWSVLRPGLCTHTEVPRYPLSRRLVRGWLDPRVSLDFSERRNIFCHYRDSNTGFPPVTKPTALSRVLRVILLREITVV
jgi:hypothetical protein